MHNVALLEAVSVLLWSVSPLSISHPGERGGQRGEGMINHAQIPQSPQACLGEYMSPPGGSLQKNSPLSYVLIGKHTPHERQTATVEGGILLLDKYLTLSLEFTPPTVKKWDDRQVRIEQMWSPHLRTQPKKDIIWGQYGANNVVSGGQR